MADYSRFFAHLNGTGGGQSVKDHLIAVAEGAAICADKLGVGSAGAIIGLLHDFGKYSNSFQRYLHSMAVTEDTEEQNNARGSVDHSTAGAQVIWRNLHPKGPRERIVAQILALCVASHHSGLIDCIAPDGNNNFQKRMDKPDADTHATEAYANTDREIIQHAERCLAAPELIGGISGLISAIYQSDKENTIRQFKVGLLVRFLFSCLIDADRTDTADDASPSLATLRQRGVYERWPELASRLESALEQFPVNSLVDSIRKQVSHHCFVAAERSKGIYTLTVPTGGGKTLASLRFALHHASKWSMDRIIYVSPYTSIIDQNAEVVRRILEPIDSDRGRVVLEHHSNLTPEEQTQRSKLLSENWDAPVVFTTAVQALEAVFGSRTRGVRRMHQMANSVLIFDEIQTLPVRCVHLFNNAINFLREQCGSTILLCTATQPLLDRVDQTKGRIRLNDTPEIVPDVRALFEGLNRHTTFDRRKDGGWTHAEAAALAIAETERAGSCLLVANTKNDALAVFRESQAQDRFPVVHLSTNMCPAHRLRKLQAMERRLRRQAPVICISTQLIEAGVDISFGAAIRVLAGLDSIAQTAGRCNRNGEMPRGYVHIINLVKPVPANLSDIRATLEPAQRVLDENSSPDRTVNLSNPNLIEQYFRYYFFDRSNEMDYPVRRNEVGRDDTLLRMLGENELATKPSHPYLRQSFMTAANAFQAIESQTQGVIVPYSSGGKTVIAELAASYDPLQQFNILKRAQRFTVNVHLNVLRKLQQSGAIYEAQEGTGILCLREQYYNDEQGLNESGTTEMEAYFA